MESQEEWTKMTVQLEDTKVRTFREVHLVTCPSVGALSVLDDKEFAGFAALVTAQGDPAAVNHLYRQLGQAPEEADQRASELIAMLRRSGWFRSELPPDNTTPLEVLYLTLTRRCNLKCDYCYQGEALARTDIELETVEHVLKNAVEVNPRCHVVIAGGEPMLHKNFFEILDLVEQSGLTFSILTNAAFLTPGEAKKLTVYKKLTRVNISVDGMTEEVHNLTRKGSFKQTMAGIAAVVDAKLPLAIAPTMHSGNLHQLVDMARFAMRQGVAFKPNQMSPTHMRPDNQLVFDVAAANNTLYEISEKLCEEFSVAHILRIQSQLSGEEAACAAKPTKDAAGGTTRKSRQICGIGRGVLDVDWNGDVYPCNLLKGDQFILGNLLETPFYDLMDEADRRGYRTLSSEIDKCGGCDFVDDCASGCRAATYFGTGSLAREDLYCPSRHEHAIKVVLRAARDRLGLSTDYPSGSDWPMGAAGLDTAVLHGSLADTPVEHQDVKRGGGRLQVLGQGPMSRLVAKDSTAEFVASTMFGGGDVR